MSGYYQQHSQVFPHAYLQELRGQIFACPYFTVNNLNRDFVGTKGFSIVFRESHVSEVCQKFPYFRHYLHRIRQAECNAFYLNPLLLEQGSRVDPHIDRSLRSYDERIAPPLWVSVLYIETPDPLLGGDLILRSSKRHVGQIHPCPNTLILFQGNLTHSVTPVSTAGRRLSLVCEQYRLDPEELQNIPEFLVESRALGATQRKSSKKREKSRV
jgi:hypothetical protein